MKKKFLPSFGLKLRTDQLVPRSYIDYAISVPLTKCIYVYFMYLRTMKNNLYVQH